MPETCPTRSTPATRPRFALWCPGNLIAVMARPYNRYLQRLDLAEIDDHLLKDLGLTREDVRRECAKSFWRL